MLYLDSCIEGAQKVIADETVDLIIADPPYNLKFRGTTQTKNKKPRFHIFPNDNLTFPDYRRFCLAWLKQAYRILKPGSHVYIFIDWRTYPDMARWLKITGFTIKNCIVWDKKNMGMGWQYRYQHEFIIMAVKGTKNVRRIRTRSQTDVWQIPRIPGNQTIHPTEKPVDMMMRIIENSSEEGEYVVDFFAGSGVVPDAAAALNRRCDAFEVDPGWYAVSMERLKGEYN